MSVKIFSSMRKCACVLCLVMMLWIDHYGGTIWLAGRYIMPEPGPFIYEETVMVPFRAVVEGLLDGTVSYENAARSVNAEVNGRTVSFCLDDEMVLVVWDTAFVPEEYIRRVLCTQISE